MTAHDKSKTKLNRMRDSAGGFTDRNGGAEPMRLGKDCKAVPCMIAVLLFLLTSGEASSAKAQAPSQGTPSAPASSREVELEAKLRAAEARMDRMAEQINAMSARLEQVSAGAVSPYGPATGPAAPRPSGFDPGNPGNAASPSIPPDAVGVPAGLQGSGNASTGSLAPSSSPTQVPAARPDINMPPVPRRDRLLGTFGPGFMLKTDDDEYVLQFHNLTQIQYLGYGQGGQNPVHDTFAVPRQWFLFSGRITRPIEYFVSFQDAIDTILPLDIFININFDERLMFKFGRIKAPFTYEFYQEPTQGGVNPELSLFTNNFGLNRQVGAEAWGQLFDKKLTYTAGLFNTARNGNVDTSDGKNLVAYLSYKPFVRDEDNFFQFLDVGGSVDEGASEVNTPIPQTFRTNLGTAGNTAVGVPFLQFNNNVRQSGPHTLWDLHTAFYRNHLSLIGEWQSGFQDYALSSSLRQHIRVPIQSFYVAGGYFLTGETVSGRNSLRPNRNFDLRKGREGLGAIELTGRFNYLNVGKDVFSSGLVDRNLWTNSLYTTDVGVNWYWNTYVKWYIDWQHAVFGAPVQYAPGRSQLTSETFTLRFQLYF